MVHVVGPCGLRVAEMRTREGGLCKSQAAQTRVVQRSVVAVVLGGMAFMGVDFGNGCPQCKDSVRGTSSDADCDVPPHQNVAEWWNCCTSH